jgi:hypothetical protein
MNGGISFGSVPLVISRKLHNVLTASIPMALAEEVEP